MKLMKNWHWLNGKGMLPVWLDKALRTSEEAEADRQRHASTVANIRAARTPEQVEADRQQHSQNVANIRAARTPEQIEADRQQHSQDLYSIRSEFKNL
jgi:hypothetical protein